jgi:hypothetical protein
VLFVDNVDGLQQHGLAAKGGAHPMPEPTTPPPPPPAAFVAFVAFHYGSKERPS